MLGEPRAALRLPLPPWVALPCPLRGAERGEEQPVVIDPLRAALDAAGATDSRHSAAAGVQLARNAIQRARDADRDRCRPFASVGESLVLCEPPAFAPLAASELRRGKPMLEFGVLRLSHKYQHATER